MLCDILKGTSCNGRKDRRGTYSDELIALDEDDICAAGLLDLCTGRRIRIQILCEALVMRLNNCVKAHRIVEACFDVACSAGSSAVKVRDLERDRLCAALEVRADRCNEDAELVLCCRLDADDCVGTEHIGADVEGRAGAVGRYPRGVRLDDCLDSFDKTVFREYRHLKTSRGVSHSRCVEVRAEADDVAVFCRISLQTFENSLRVLQNTCRLGDRYGRIIDESALIPCAVLEVRDISFVCRHISKAETAPVDIFLFHILPPA